MNTLSQFILKKRKEFDEKFEDVEDAILCNHSERHVENDDCKKLFGNLKQFIQELIQELIKEEKESIPVEAIERMLVNPNQGAYAVNAVYVSPAQRLRNEAERMEQQESDYYVVKEWLQSLREKIEKGEL